MALCFIHNPDKGATGYFVDAGKPLVIDLFQSQDFFKKMSRSVQFFKIEKGNLGRQRHGRNTFI
jgi:hypothetical protein